MLAFTDNMLRHAWTLGGRYFGYWEGNDLWSYHGKHVGRLRGFKIFAPDGRYLGELLANGRLASTPHRHERLGLPYAARSSREPQILLPRLPECARPRGYADFNGPDELTAIMPSASAHSPGRA
jgi:hypothetical protein